MATIKSYTDIPQSNKLAEILPLESADMHYYYDYNFNELESIPNITEEDDHFVLFPKDVRCWSLAALLDVLPDRTCVFKKTYKDGRVKYQGVMEGNKELILKNNPVDACVAMIEKLNKLNLL